MKLYFLFITLKELMMRIKGVLLLLLVLNWSCQNEIDDTSTLKKYLSKKGITDISSFEYYIFLPIDNCGAALDFYRKFVVLNQENVKLKMIVCSYNAKNAKMIAQNAAILEESQVVKIQYPLIDNFIKVFKIKDNKVRTWFELRPSELPQNELFHHVY